MRVLYERCCGLDVHKQSMTACALTPEGKEIRTFGTLTDDLEELVDWCKLAHYFRIPFSNYFRRIPK
ncbi:hypothetical protein GC56T2_0783 [Geobacillus sp. C56-T2]|nr:hypothetical protein GC56T2_0783 [Geobacillus sp. C56-T2]